MSTDSVAEDPVTRAVSLDVARAPRPSRPLPTRRAGIHLTAWLSLAMFVVLCGYGLNAEAADPFLALCLLGLSAVALLGAAPLWRDQ